MFDAAINAVAEAQPQVAQVVPVTPGLVVHVDGDYLANYDGAVDIPAGEARQNALARIAAFKARIGAESIVVHNTSAGCHKGERYLIATVKKYQAQRTGTKPKNCDYLKDFFQNYEGDLFRTKNWSSREADDGIGACSHFATGLPVGYIGIATADKDMRMLPGVHINWRTPTIVTRVHPGEYDVIGEDGKQYGLKWFFIQMLMGDDADHCPGLEKYGQFNKDGSFDKFKPCGEKTAFKFLEGITTVQDACARVIQLYRQGYYGRSPGHAEDRFCEQAGLMWMRLDTQASITDFATHAGFSRINHAFDDAIWAAVERLSTRVRLARQQIDELADSHDPLNADCSPTG